MSVVAVVLSSAAGGCPAIASTFGRTALKPRAMLVPWSPSPIAESRRVSSSAFSRITSVMRRRISRVIASLFPTVHPLFELRAACFVPVTPAPAARAPEGRAERDGSRTTKHATRQAPLHAPPQRGGVDGRVPQVDELVVEPQQGDRHACHLERGDVVPHEGPGDGDAAVAQDSV